MQLFDVFRIKPGLSSHAINKWALADKLNRRFLVVTVEHIRGEFKDRAVVHGWNHRGNVVLPETMVEQIRART